MLAIWRDHFVALLVAEETNMDDWVFRNWYERVFSKLKIIKNRLRPTLSRNSLTPLMLISIEKDISENIHKEDIINKISKSSVELKSLLQ